MRRRLVRSGLVLVVSIALGLGAIFGLRALWNVAKKHLTADTCTVGTYELDPAQAAVASTMVGAVTTYRIALPERASVLVLAAGLQESKLTNLAPGQGDRDSVGVLQQRPSQGWGGGDPAVLNNVAEATKEFLDALINVPNWQSLPLSDAVQAVQRSADGSLYAQHEDEAQALADALQGVKPAAISCSFAAPTEVASASVVAQQASQQLGINTPVGAGSQVTVPGAHWQTAAWLVANADRLGIEQVAYAGRTWSRTSSWTTSSAPTTAVVATLYQLNRS
jgi:hypothetical protein